MIPQRRIDVTLSAGTVDPKTGALTTFDGGARTVKLTGLRARARIVRAGFPGMADLDLQIWGMTLGQMNTLNTLGANPQLNGTNSVTIEAGDAGGQMAIVFSDAIRNAWSDFNSMPDVPFRIEAHGGLALQTAQLDPTSVRGPVDAATIMAQLAQKGELSFENNGVSVILRDTYLTGSVRDQMLALRDHAGIEAEIDDGVLAIWPKGGSRTAAAPIEIGPDTGMVGYPSFTSVGILLRTVYDKSLRFGATINVTSSLTPARGRWVIQRLDHDLASLQPGGPWFSTIAAVRPGLIST